MKPHGINVGLTYEVIGKGSVKSETINSKLEGWINFENLKTGKKVTLPFRSFVGQFLNTIHGVLSGDSGADTRVQSTSCAATNAQKASCGLLLGRGIGSRINVTDTTLDTQATNASLYYYAHTYNAPSYSGYNNSFSFSRVIANEYSAAMYPTNVGIKTRGASEVGIPSVSSASRLISKDSNIFTIDADESVRITFTFNAAMDVYQGGIVENFVKFIYNTLIKGNINHPNSLMKSRTGTTPTYVIASDAAIGSVAATMGDLFIGSSGTGYIGIVIVPWDASLPAPFPGSYQIFPDHTGFTVGVNSVSAIEYVTVNNGANFSVVRNFTNSGTSMKKIGKIGLLTRGNSANVTGATLHANQILLMDNRPSTDYIEVAPGQILKVTYNFGIQV